jgi:hypothetical protein
MRCPPLPAASPHREQDNIRDTIGGRAMTELSAIEKLVTRLSPEPVCDDCITQTLGLSRHENADQAARELVGSNGFERAKDICSLCGEVRLVTRRH